MLCNINKVIEVKKWWGGGYLLKECQTQTTFNLKNSKQ